MAQKGRNRLELAKTALLLNRMMGSFFFLAGNSSLILKSHLINPITKDYCEKLVPNALTPVRQNAIVARVVNGSQCISLFLTMKLKEKYAKRVQRPK